jgi:hypothetical protein
MAKNSQNPDRGEFLALEVVLKAKAGWKKYKVEIQELSFVILGDIDSELEQLICDYPQYFSIPMKFTAIIGVSDLIVKSESKDDRLWAFIRYLDETFISFARLKLLYYSTWFNPSAFISQEDQKMLNTFRTICRYLVPANQSGRQVIYTGTLIAAYKHFFIKMYGYSPKTLSKSLLTNAFTHVARDFKYQIEEAGQGYSGALLDLYLMDEDDRVIIEKTKAFKEPIKQKMWANPLGSGLKPRKIASPKPEQVLETMLGKTMTWEKKKDS